MSVQDYKNIILVGPSGSLGTALLTGLLNEPRFNVTALIRSSSHALEALRDKPKLRLITIDETYPEKSLVKAFKGQDAVVSALTSLGVAQQYRMIDAAVEAGVKRFVASEYGLDNLNTKAQALNTVFRDKGMIQGYLKSKESEGLTWHSIACGMWIKWYLSFLHIYCTETIRFR
jgi:uncharacterized protein YbjT (DUF2867 family)